MEFGVLSDQRGRGTGRALHDALLEDRPEALALLTVREDATAAQIAYSTWGWRKVGYLPKGGSPGYDVLVMALSDLDVRQRPATSRDTIELSG